MPTGHCNCANIQSQLENGVDASYTIMYSSMPYLDLLSGLNTFLYAEIYLNARHVNLSVSIYEM